MTFSDTSAPSEPDNLTVLHELYAGLPDAERYQRVAYDVFHFMLASQANMYAALSWTLINVLTQDTQHVEQIQMEIDALRRKHGQFGSCAR